MRARRDRAFTLYQCLTDTTTYAANLNDILNIPS
jgi:hypothetical protein